MHGSTGIDPPDETETPYSSTDDDLLVAADVDPEAWPAWTDLVLFTTDLPKAKGGRRGRT